MIKQVICLNNRNKLNLASNLFSEFYIADNGTRFFVRTLVMAISSRSFYPKVDIAGSLNINKSLQNAEALHHIDGSIIKFSAITTAIFGFFLFSLSLFFF